MRVKYLSQLKGILKLRCEYSEARKQSALAKKSIKNINCTLMTDYVVNDNFTEIGKERLVKIRSIKNYNSLSIDKIDRNCSAQSKKLKSIWKKHLEIKDYLTNCKFFTGLKEKVKENEEKYHISKNIKEVEKHRKLITELFNERSNLNKIKKDFSDLFEILNSLPIFKALLASLQERKRRIMMANTIETINSQHAWIVELIKEKKILEKTAKDVSSLYEILNSLQIFKELLSSLQEHEREIMMAKTIEKIKSHHVWIIKLIKEKKILNKTVKDIQDLSQTLNSFPIYKKLLLDFKRHENCIIEAKDIETINNHYAWFDRIAKQKNDLNFIVYEINEFNKFFKNNSFFTKDKWLTLLEKDCANAKTSSQIEELNAKTKARKQLLSTIDKVSHSWDKMIQYCSDVYNQSVANEYCNKDKKSIIDRLSQLESQSKLDNSEARKIHNQLKKKFNHIRRMENKPYPCTGWITDIFLFIFIWPFTYLIRKLDKSSSIKKPVLDW